MGSIGWYPPIWVAGSIGPLVSIQINSHAPTAVKIRRECLCPGGVHWMDGVHSVIGVHWMVSSHLGGGPLAFKSVGHRRQSLREEGVFIWVRACVGGESIIRTLTFKSVATGRSASPESATCAAHSVIGVLWRVSSHTFGCRGGVHWTMRWHSNQ